MSVTQINMETLLGQIHKRCENLEEQVKTLESVKNDVFDSAEGLANIGWDLGGVEDFIYIDDDASNPFVAQTILYEFKDKLTAKIEEVDKKWTALNQLSERLEDEDIDFTESDFEELKSLLKI